MSDDDFLDDLGSKKVNLSAHVRSGDLGGIAQGGMITTHTHQVAPIDFNFYVRSTNLTISLGYREGVPSYRRALT
jgi:hypothetical protein